MKLTLESAVDYSKANAMSMKHHFSNEHSNEGVMDLSPMVTFYSKDVDAPLFQIILPEDAMSENNKRMAYQMATSVGSFIHADYITLVNDVFMSKHDANTTTKEEVIENAPRPSEDINRVEGLLIVGMSRDRGVVHSQEYGLDDIGKMYFKDSSTDSFSYDGIDDEELERSWMTRVLSMALNDTGFDKTGLDKNDSNIMVALLFHAMNTMQDLDFMCAYTNLFGDYIYDKFYDESLQDETKSILQKFKDGESTDWEISDDE